MTYRLPQPGKARIAVIGLGYVGLPLAIAFGQRQPTVGYDIDERRIAELEQGSDPTREVTREQLDSAGQLSFTADATTLADCQAYIIAVPTPVDRHKRPDLSHLEDACRAVAQHLKPGDIVIFEATVYPGCTEEVCIPILEAGSNLTCALDTPNRVVPAKEPGPRTPEPESPVVPAPEPGPRTPETVAPAEAQQKAGTSHTENPTPCRPGPRAGTSHTENPIPCRPGPRAGTSHTENPIPCRPGPRAGTSHTENPIPCRPGPRAGTSHAESQHTATNETGKATGEPNPTSEQFHVGYSPERINPGDSAHSLKNVVKITAGGTPEAAQFVDQLYKSVVDAGTHPVSSIAVAEAAKVIENTQRDLNIALVNELSLIFNRLGLDTTEVLEAAGTKWNFLPFRPGLVGGHCIGVDPYYLTYKAEAVGYHPQVILAGRRINDGMGRYVAGELVKLMIRRGIAMRDARVLVLGLAFKENCADIRNTRVIDIIEELESYRLQVDVHDPWVTTEAARSELGIETIEKPPTDAYDGVVIAVGHEQFREHGIEAIRKHARDNGVVYDVKSIFSRPTVDARL